jgi:hypothetical protein
VDAPSAKACWPKLQLLNSEQLQFVSQLLVNAKMSPSSDVDAGVVNTSLHDYLESDGLLKSERVKAGVHLMLLSEMAREILGIKKLCSEHQPLILDVLEQFSERLRDEDLNSEKCLSALLHQYEVTKEFKGVFKGKLSQLCEVGSWLRSLNKLSREAMAVLINVCSRVLIKSKDSCEAFRVGLKVWTESEALKVEDRSFAQLWTNLSFAKANSDLKEMVMVRMGEVECLLGIIRAKSPDKLKGLSPYLLDVLYRHEKLYRKSAGLDLLLDREMRVSFKMLSLEIAQLKPKLSRVHHLELLELESQPLQVKGQLSYFQGQVPEVMFRSNGREVQSMSKTLGYCYRQIPNRIDDDDSNLKDVAQNMLTETVTNTTALVREFHRSRSGNG